MTRLHSRNWCAAAISVLLTLVAGCVALSVGTALASPSALSPAPSDRSSIVIREALSGPPDAPWDPVPHPSAPRPDRARPVDDGAVALTPADPVGLEARFRITRAGGNSPRLAAAPPIPRPRCRAGPGVGRDDSAIRRRASAVPRGSP